jgi:hypothetical protein
VHIGIILVNGQLDAQFLFHIYFRICPTHATGQLTGVTWHYEDRTGQLSLYKCTFQSAETGWKACTNPLQRSVAITIFKCVSPYLWRENGAGFYVLLTVHIGIILVNDQLDAQFFFFLYTFIQNLYMFRALMCSSLGELIVSIHLVYVTLCRWPSGMQLWVPPKPAYQTVTYVEWHIPYVVLIQWIRLMMSTWVLETCRDFE